MCDTANYFIILTDKGIFQRETWYYWKVGNYSILVILENFAIWDGNCIYIETVRLAKEK